MAMMKPKRGKRAFWIQMAVTLTVLALYFVSWFTHSKELPFLVQPQTAHRGIIVARPGIPLPRGLYAGDQVPLALQTTRVLALLQYPYVPSTRSWPLKVIHNDKIRTIQVRTQRFGSPALFAGAKKIFEVARVLALLLGLITLWRGRSWTAWGISIFALVEVIQEPLGQFAAMPYFNLVFKMIWPLAVLLPPLGLYVMARSLTRIQRPCSVVLDALVGLFLGEALFGGIAGLVLDLMTARLKPYAWLSFSRARYAVFVLWAMVIGILIWGFFRAQPEDRVRIRWILVATLLFIPAVLLSVIAVHSASGTALSGWLVVVMLGLYSYAVLSQRLVDVRIALNRAIVFSFLMATVVGLFALLESLIERTAIGSEAGMALEITLPLLLGILFHQLHRRIESMVDRFIFRSEYRSREVLRTFVRDAGFIDSPSVLAGRIARIFGTHAGGQGAALYESSGLWWQRTSAYGPTVFPDRVGTDDPGVVRLRATLTPLDLHGMGSALGPDTLVLPLALRGDLYAMLLIGPRLAGRYAQSEIEHLETLAHEAGAALFALQARVNQAELESLKTQRNLLVSQKEFLEKLVQSLGIGRSSSST